MFLHHMPDVVTHAFHPEAKFLSNICDLSRDEAERILTLFRANGARRKSNYLDRRLETEAWLIEERKRLCGETRRERPIYFFLGNFEDWKDASRPDSLIMPLRAFPPEVLTFTYPDSMTSFSAVRFDGQQAERKPYHGRVFSLVEIEHVIREFGFPGSCWQQQDTFGDRFIEMQVWDERPITEFLVSRHL